jgi:uncharacterized membrane protein YccC
MKVGFISVDKIGSCMVGPQAVRWLSSASEGGWLAHSARTGIAAAVSLGVAQGLGMPEAYWAPITTAIVMQSTLGAAWAVSKQRVIGTALGAAVGGLLATYVEPGIILLGTVIFALGLLCGVLRLDQSAYRFAGITLMVVTLVARGQSPFLIAVHRCVEVSLGVAVALTLTALWPTRELASGKS